VTRSKWGVAGTIRLVDCLYVALERSPKEEMPMKILVSTFAIAVALALSGMAYAAEDKWAAETEADCLKVGGVWIADAKDCQAPGGQAVEKELQEESK